MMFWIVASVLTALALGFVIWPLTRSRTTRADDREPRISRRALMGALYRDRMAELESEAAAGQLADDIRGEVVDELGANLLDEYRAAESAAADDPEPAGPRRRTAVWMTLVLLPAAALAVYLSAGTPDATTLAGASAVLHLDPEADREQIEHWREVLDRRVARVPDDGHSWYLLGVSRLLLDDFGPAAEAFGKAHTDLGGNPSLDVYWLQARYLAAGGRMDEGARLLADRILEQRPNHPLVLEILALDAYRRGDYRAAVEHLNRALNNRLATPQQASLLAGLSQARARMGTLTPTIDVEISAPDGVPRDGTLFVIARPPGGGMPFAVVRRPAGMLPLSVRLDDTVSMSGVKLSSAGAVEVVVRLSRSGRPMAGPGDWEWQSEILDPGEVEEPVKLQARLAPRNEARS